MALVIIDTEVTGSVTRVYLTGVGEDDVADAAREALGGTDALPDVVYHSEDGSYEAIFENADLY